MILRGGGVEGASESMDVYPIAVPCVSSIPPKYQKNNERHGKSALPVEKIAVLFLFCDVWYVLGAGVGFSGSVA